MNSLLIYYAPVEQGGLTQYAIHQIRAFYSQGVRLHCIGYDFFIEKIRNEFPDISYTRLDTVPEIKKNIKILSFFQKFNQIRKNTRVLVSTINKMSARYVLFTAYMEYFSPFWVYSLIKLKRNGVYFGVIVHDPIRDFFIGPKWFHRWSVSRAYSFINVAFVHDDIQIDTGWPVINIKSVVIPHGIYYLPLPKQLPSKQILRQEFKIPEGVTVLLSFGHIRDGKNLDLVIRAISKLPKCHLLVAGSEQSSSQKQVSYYKKLANELGISARCHWYPFFIPNEDAYRYFMVSDIALLLYSEKFQSASGVLNVNINFQLPVLASSGNSPIKNQIQKYNLGIWIEPDNLEKIIYGIESLSNSIIKPKFKEYIHDNSWSENVKIILTNLKINL